VTGTPPGPPGARPEPEPEQEPGYECARAWSALSAAHAQVSGRLSAELARACGLTINDFEILLRLDHGPAGGQRLTELNAGVPLTQPALSRAVGRLAARDCVSRTGTPADRRGVLIAITPAGRALLRAAIPVHGQVIRELLTDRLAGPELDLLARALSRVTSPSADAVRR
jgi:DNA-binding MarR family transcriptional regulator